jgi:DNA mismatch repair ATPase MutL
VERTTWRTDAGTGPVVMTAIAGVAPPPLPADGTASALAERYAAQLREARTGQLGLDVARSWVRDVKAHVRAGRAAEAERTSSFGFRSGTEAEPGTEVGAARPEARGPTSEARHGKPEASFFAALTYLGQLDRTYLVCEAQGELVLIDQHLAHERVELARLEAQGERDVPIQRMLFPQTIEVDPELVALADNLRDVLARVGFEAEAFGKTTLAVKAVPAAIRHGDPSELLRDLLTRWAREGAPSEEERVARILAEIACHSVVRAGDRLSHGEAEALLRDMDSADFSTHGPHGRPAILRLPLAEIARRFGR